MKKNLIYYVASMLLVAGQTLHAQQEAMYTQYMFNTLAINPAYAGSRNVVSATGLFRKQLLGFPGEPETVTFTIDAPVKDKNIGLGFQAFNDRIGVTSTTGAYGTYAYRIRFDRGTLAIGIMGGVSQYIANLRNVTTSQPNDPQFSTNINKFLLNFGTGVYYNTDNFFVGLSAPQLLDNKLNDLDTAVVSNIAAQEYIHLFFSMGGVIRLGEDYKLKPSFLIKAVQGAPIEADINATLWIKDIIGAGVQFRTNADMAANLEVQLSQQFRLGYSYDRSINGLAGYNNGSHELMLRYEFGFDKSKIITPRYF